VFADLFGGAGGTTASTALSQATRLARVSRSGLAFPTHSHHTRTQHTHTHAHTGVESVAQATPGDRMRTTSPETKGAAAAQTQPPTARRGWRLTNVPAAPARGSCVTCRSLVAEPVGRWRSHTYVSGVPAPMRCGVPAYGHVCGHQMIWWPRLRAPRAHAVRRTGTAIRWLPPAHASRRVASPPCAPSPCGTAHGHGHQVVNRLPRTHQDSCGLASVGASSMPLLRCWLRARACVGHGTLWRVSTPRKTPASLPHHPATR